LTLTRLAEEDAASSVAQDLFLRKFPQWTVAHWCICVFAASFLILALLPEARLPDYDVPNGAETVRVARSLAAHGAFADPFASLPTGPTAHVAPVYPFLYSLVLRVLGTGHAALQVMWAFNVAFLAVQMAFLPLLSHRLQFGVLPGIIAAGLGTFSLHAPVDTRWECFLAGALLLFVCLASKHAFTQEDSYWSFALGALWGVLILTQPVMLLLLAAWMLCFVLFADERRKALVLRRSGIVVAVALLAVAPWIARNYMRFGSFIFVRDCLGMELYTSNYSCVSPTLRETMLSGCHARTNPNTTARISAELIAAGEVRYNHAKLEQALTWMIQNPRRFLELTLQRFRLFWFPSLERTWEAALVWGVTLLSFPGVWFMAKKSRFASALIVTAWLVFPLIYYVGLYEPRYRYAIYWTSLLPAGFAVTEMVRRLRSSAAA
jgi:4-amino-4-deoxy-L-arabinose transferase-like glycosyltransferase